MKKDDTPRADAAAAESTEKNEHLDIQGLEASDIPSRLLPKDRRFGREIAFGIQQTLACWATDFIDPYIGKWYQNKYGNKQHEVTSAHTWGGELAGDSAALFVYLAAKRTLSKPIDAVVQVVKKATDSFYDKLGRKSLKSWRKERHLEKDDPLFLQKLDSYKEFQAENLVDSTIIAGSSTLINVGAQRALGNKQAMGLILTSKLIGAALTMGTMLGLRTALPDATKTLDDELSDKYFSKVVSVTQKALGASEEPIDPHASSKAHTHEDEPRRSFTYDGQRPGNRHAGRVQATPMVSYADSVRKDEEQSSSKTSSI